MKMSHHYVNHLPELLRLRLAQMFDNGEEVERLRIELNGQLVAEVGPSKVRWTDKLRRKLFR